MRCEVDRKGVRGLAYDRALVAPCRHYAELAELHAIATAPRGSRPRASGTYAGGLFVRTLPTPWVAVTYGSDDFKAWWVEFGTVRGVPRRTGILREAARAAGMRLDMRAVPKVGRFNGA
jgi:phage gp29-like protein